MKKEREEFVDDGHTIVNMNVEGASWFRPERKPSELVSDRETTWLILKESWKAAALVCGIFSAGLILTMLAFF